MITKKKSERNNGIEFNVKRFCAYDINKFTFSRRASLSPHSILSWSPSPTLSSPCFIHILFSVSWCWVSFICLRKIAFVCIFDSFPYSSSHLNRWAKNIIVRYLVCLMAWRLKSIRNIALWTFEKGACDFGIRIRRLKCLLCVVSLSLPLFSSPNLNVWFRFFFTLKFKPMQKIQ